MVALIKLEEDASYSYAPRTYVNANIKNCDLTIAFATDFTTAGERCTMTAAGRNYQAIPLNWDVQRMVGHISKAMFEKKATRLNIAGNGIYSLLEHDIDQDTANLKIYEVLKGLLDKGVVISSIRSGGQTGIDMAGLIAGHALGIPVTGYFPRGFRQRNADKEDYNADVPNLFAEIHESAARLNPDAFHIPDGSCHCHT